MSPAFHWPASIGILGCSVHLVQLFLPIRDNDGQPFDYAQFRLVRTELAERFGGVTAHMRAPASGLWQDEGGDVDRDDLVIFEVVVERFDRKWWTAYRQTLEARFRQKSIHGRVLSVTVL